MNQLKHTTLPRFTLIIMAMLLGVLLAACTQQPATPTDEDLGFEEPAEGLQGTPIPGQGGLTDDPNASVVTTPDAIVGDENELNPENMEVVSLSDILDNPEQYIGQTITIQAPLGEVLADSAFTLGDPEVLGLDSLLVVGADQATIPLENGVFGPEATEAVEDSLIEVTGVIQQFDPTMLEQQLGYELPEPIFGAFQDQTAIVAERVRVLSEELSQ